MAVKEARRIDRSSASDVRFERIHQVRAHEYVAEQIRRHIALRLIKPGEALPAERELAVMFGVGRPTIQHALRLLEAAGLVEARRGRRGGTFITQRDQDSPAADDLILRVMRHRKELEDLLLYRRLVEPAVARVAATTRRGPDLAAMRRAIDGMVAATSEPDYMQHDTDFHIAVARATGNAFLVRAIEEIRMRLNDAMTLLPESDAWHKRISGEHEELLGAIEKGDAEAAETAMQEHVANSEQGLRAVLAAIRRRGWAGDPSLSPSPRPSPRRGEGSGDASSRPTPEPSPRRGGGSGDASSRPAPRGGDAGLSPFAQSGVKDGAKLIAPRPSPPRGEGKGVASARPTPEPSPPKGEGDGDAGSRPAPRKGEG